MVMMLNTLKTFLELDNSTKNLLVVTWNYLLLMPCTDQIIVIIKTKSKAKTTS